MASTGGALTFSPIVGCRRRSAPGIAPPTRLVAVAKTGLTADALAAQLRA
jgi:hypothetical protein